MQVQVTTQHALMLQSKCKAKARRLQALHQSHSKLTHTVQQLHMDKQQLQHMQSNKKSSSLTPYEWSLLQSGDKMRRHEESLVAAAYMADACRQAQLHAAAFFHWLSSLHEQDRPVGGAACQVSKLRAWQRAEQEAADCSLKILHAPCKYGVALECDW